MLPLEGAGGRIFFKIRGGSGFKFEQELRRERKRKKNLKRFPFMPLKRGKGLH